MQQSSSQKLSSDELIRQGVAAPPLEIESDCFSFPDDSKITVLPPIILDETDEPTTAVEKASRRLGTNSRRSSKRRRVFGKTVPKKYENDSDISVLFHRFLSKLSVGTIASLLFHLLLFLILATIVIQVRVGTLGKLEVGVSPEMGDLLSVDFAGDVLETESSFETRSETERSPFSNWDELENPTQNLLRSLEVGSAAETDAERKIDQESGSGGVPILRQTGSTSGRTEKNRTQGIPGREGDTTKESEDAVERGLKWIADHQFPDGGWAFDLTGKDRNGQTIFCDCSNTSQNPKNHDAYLTALHPSRTAATALALLPFLGAGYTHTRENKYQNVVNAGLEFLKYQAAETPDGFDFRSDWAGQGMYIQGIAALTLCEAYEMTGDESIQPYAQGAIRFIESAQRDDGGWRYHIPTESLEFYKDASGDTTVTGWQMMALKSALSAGLDVHPSTVYRVGDFLELVQNEGGSQYRYLPKTNESEDKLWATTAVGLLIRLYLGWNKQVPAFKKGSDYLVRWLQESYRDWNDFQKGKKSKKTLADAGTGAFVHNLYFSYYAILVLHLSDDSEWNRAFARMREFLIASQFRGTPGDSLRGHSESGSWLFSDLYLNDGGRLLYTVLAVLILETPYRYLPMYSDQQTF